MKHSPSWEANRFSFSQIPRILWNPKVPYRIHTSSPPVPILSHLDPVHAPTSHCLRIHLNIILPSTPGSSSVLFPSGFPTKNPVYASPVPHTCCMPLLSHSSRFNHPNCIWWGVQRHSGEVRTISWIISKEVCLGKAYRKDYRLLKWMLHKYGVIMWAASAGSSGTQQTHRRPYEWLEFSKKALHPGVISFYWLNSQQQWILETEHETSVSYLLDCNNEPEN